jgi:hypothetical protein
LKYFISMYENRIIKPVKIIFKRGKIKSNRVGKINQSTLYVHIEISQSNPFVQLIYANKNI